MNIGFKKCKNANFAHLHFKYKTVILIMYNYLYIFFGNQCDYKFAIATHAV